MVRPKPDQPDRFLGACTVAISAVYTDVCHDYLMAALLFLQVVVIIVNLDWLTSINDTCACV